MQGIKPRSLEPSEEMQGGERAFYGVLKDNHAGDLKKLEERDRAWAGKPEPPRRRARSRAPVGTCFPTSLSNTQTTRRDTVRHGPAPRHVNGCHTPRHHVIRAEQCYITRSVSQGGMRPL